MDSCDASLAGVRPELDVTHAQLWSNPQPERLVLDLPTTEGRKAEFELCGCYTKMVYPPTDGNPSKY